MSGVTLTWLGTGNFLVPPARYWNSFIAEGVGGPTVLVEPSPTALPNLRRAGHAVEHLDAIVISHFHPDHTFGCPFLLLEILQRGRRSPLHVIGPPGVAGFLEEMMRFGSTMDIHEGAHRKLDIRYTEADESQPSQAAGELVFRAVKVEHVPELECYGYLLELGDMTLGYSGDTKPCQGLDELAGASDVLVLECNGVHESHSHMHVDAVRSLRQRYPNPKMIVSHLGADVEAEMLPGVVMPDDFAKLDFP